MSEPVKRPVRKNPLIRSRLQLLPPQRRSRVAHGLTQAAAEGRFALQRCHHCRQFIYPPRDACPSCLSCDLPFEDAPRSGTILSETMVHVPSDPYFRERAPWRTGMVKLDCGPRIVAHIHQDCVEGNVVRMSLQLDKAGQAVLFALPTDPTENMKDDLQLREMTADPKYRRILVTDGTSEVAVPLAKALAAAQAEKIYVGIAMPWRSFKQEQALAELDRVEIVALDLSDEKSIAETVADIGHKIDIVVNTSDHVRPSTLFDKGTARVLSESLEAVLMGPVRLASHLGPVMASRGADGVNSAAAWVNLLSVHALSNTTGFGMMSVAHAAGLSFSQWLRRDLQAAGIRVVNIFFGPLDTEWFQTVPPPKVAPKALADAVVKCLREGIEDHYFGDVAQDIRARFLANSKALEREGD